MPLREKLASRVDRGERHPSLDDGEEPSYRVKQPRNRNQKVWPSHVGAFRQASRTLTERWAKRKVPAQTRARPRNTLTSPD
jgi:hypothetical protein